MKIDRTAGEKIFSVFNYLLMIVLMLITLYPFYYVVMASLSDPVKIVAHSGLIGFPIGFSLSAYESVFKYKALMYGYMNTIIYVVFGTFLNLVFTSLGAYVLSRQRFKLKKAFTVFMMFTMFFSGGIIPLFLLVKSMGILNTRLAIVLPGLISTFNLIVMRTNFASIPYSLEESAKIDGANDFVVLFKIILPLSKAVISVMILYYGVNHWNSWFNAMIFLDRRALYPLQLILREILIASSTDNLMTNTSGADKMAVGATIKYATIIIATVPILMIYPFLQKYFVKGMMIGAVKE